MLWPKAQSSKAAINGLCLTHGAYSTTSFLGISKNRHYYFKSQVPHYFITQFIFILFCFIELCFVNLLIYFHLYFNYIMARNLHYHFLFNFAMNLWNRNDLPYCVLNSINIVHVFHYWNTIILRVKFPMNLYYVNSLIHWHFNLNFTA